MANNDVRFIGNYKILDLIGKGGMAKIYTALHLALNRVVVLKAMGKTESRRRFKQEALLTATLNHSSIVATYDYFTDGNDHYIVMEYVEGVNLADIIQQAAPLHPKIAAYIAHQLCSALNHAHKNGVMHRDIKPTNILISKQGEIKITDFGVAKAEDSPQLTTSGMVIGTPFYMSPEQAAGEELTNRSDIYSLGIVLYEMLTGKKPYAGENSAAITGKVCRGKYRSPLWLDPHHSLRLNFIIKKAMRKNVNTRYQSAEQMQRDLERFVGWKNIGRGNSIIVDLSESIEENRRATTIVRHTPKKRGKKKKSDHTLLYLFLIMIIVAILAYLIKLVLS
ncbi:hypothetical protein A2Y85_00145 [candidate division WOR-3 bacterium RBG_13_43_14]|uniref:non-specific serine/threonine protein kinase n=1 Tax=candidate division WOR-3 bacterium RBG_13_43_14 TaxID=1802590 RepID=A0A1F4UD94_UNCW3|nr:MAG: hypothetical protein A2Y85_00145 [candidate division WOR-3 bacterium RBG_13_43_14]